MNGIAAVEGAGTRPVLVLHGWALDSGIWLAARALTDLAEFTYAYFDFPGYGAHRPAAPTEGLDGMARAALDAADELGWDSFGVLGHSMGGAAAIRVATLAPERVTSVVALTPVSAQGTALGDEGYESFRSAWTDPGPALGSLAPHLTDRQLGNIVARCRTTMDQTVWESYLANWTGASFAEQLGVYAAPTTVCYGADDALVTQDYIASTVAGLRAGRLVRIDGAGHYPMLEQSEAVVSLWEEAL